MSEARRRDGISRFVRGSTRHDPATLRHLLRGPEVHGWLSRELERLQVQLRAPNTPPSLGRRRRALPGLMDAVPEADWDTVLADTFSSWECRRAVPSGLLLLRRPGTAVPGFPCRRFAADWRSKV